MKALILICSIASLALAANAQERHIWTHPSGAYALDYGAVGWKIGGPFSFQGRSALVTFEPSGAPRQAGECTIFEGRVEELPADTDQARANGVAERSYAAEVWSTDLGYDAANVRAFANEMIPGGVRVATLVVDSTGSHPLRNFYRSFILSTPQGPTFEEISCSIALGARAEDVEKITQLLSSLRFAGSGAAP